MFDIPGMRSVNECIHSEANIFASIPKKKRI